MTLIERVARAIAIAGLENPDEKVGSLLNPEKVIWQDYEAQAQAAIKAVVEHQMAREDILREFASGNIA